VGKDPGVPFQHIQHDGVGRRFDSVV
jgi:hypothetical protein